MARKSNSKRNTRVQNVRVLDEYMGEDGVKFDRILSNLQNTHSQTRVLIQDEFNLSAATTNTNSILAGSQVRVMDDFNSMAAQFQTFRITMIRYDIYDLNPSLVTTGAFSTFHDVNTTSSQYIPTFSTVIDAPDSQIVAPGTGKISLIWRAMGATENQFQSTGTTQPAPLDFGGLRYSIPAVTSAGPKFAVIVKAVVDFRGRF